MLEPDLGKLTLRRVTTQRLDAYYASLVRDRGLSAASIRHVHAVLRGSLGQAVRWGWIPTNPAAAASPPRIQRHEISPPPIHDTRELLKTADEQSPEFGALLRVLAATGARRGEVCGLRWSDIDCAAGTVSIHRSVATVTGGIVIKDTKTHAARRIAIDSETLPALERQRVRMEERARICRLAFNEHGIRVHLRSRRLASVASRHDHRRFPTTLRQGRPEGCSTS